MLGQRSENNPISGTRLRFSQRHSRWRYTGLTRAAEAITLVM
jgi:hypothetical protein